jgi:hypothetical protein
LKKQTHWLLHREAPTQVRVGQGKGTLRESRSRQRGTFSDSSRVIALAWRKGELIALKWGDLQFGESWKRDQAG